MESIKEIVDYIVENSIKLKNKYAEEKSASLDWVAIFTRSEEEFKDFLKKTNSLGEVIQDTETGPFLS